MGKCGLYTVLICIVVFGIFIADQYYRGPGAQMRTIARKTADQLIKQNTIAVAVLDFKSVDGVLSNLSPKITNKFKAKLSLYSSNFKISDRSEIQRLIDEHRLSDSTGLLLDETVTELGNIYGINSVIRGKYVAKDKWGRNYDEIEIFVDIIDLKTGSVVTFETGVVITAAL